MGFLFTYLDEGFECVLMELIQTFLLSEFGLFRLILLFVEDCPKKLPEKSNLYRNTSLASWETGP
jgi:hypothetical protein